MNTVLDRELSLFLEDSESFKMLRHPLVYAVPYTEEMNEHLNSLLISKRVAVQTAIKNKNYNSVIFLHERPHRLSALLEHVPRTPKLFWSSAREVWSDSENIHQHYNAWRMLLKGANTFYMMDKNERKIYKKMKADNKFINIYRGVSEFYEDGISWSTDKKVAEFFANRFGQSNGIVLKAVVHPNNIKAFLLNRNESEVITLKPENVQVINA